VDRDDGAVKPPGCHVCGRGLPDVPDGEEPAAHFSLVQFGLDPEEQATERDRDAAGWTGQPTGAVWFCRRHVDLAEPHVGEHWRAALAAIDASGPA
jgi:hypothetical protein